MKNLKIALDIDDVLFSFFPHACQKFGRIETKCDIWDGVGVNRWIVDSFSEIAKDLDFWRTIPVLSRANSIDFEVTAYITYSPEEVLPVRKEWLNKHGFPVAPIICTKNKLETMICHDIDVLIEDKVSTVNEINNSFTDKIALQFKPPYMSMECDDKSKIITHLSEVKNKLIL